MPLLAIELLVLWVILPVLLTIAAAQGFRSGVLEDDGVAGACGIESVTTVDAAKALFSREIQGCEIPDSANTWRGFYGVGVAIALLAILYVSAHIITFGPETFGPPTLRGIGEVMLFTVLGITGLLIAAVLLVVYMVVVAFAFMTGLVVLMALTSG